MTEPAPAAEPINPENNHLPNEPIVNNRPRNNNANANNTNNANPQQQPVRLPRILGELFFTVLF